MSLSISTLRRNKILNNFKIIKLILVNLMEIGMKNHTKKIEGKYSD